MKAFSSNLLLAGIWTEVRNDWTVLQTFGYEQKNVDWKLRGNASVIMQETETEFCSRTMLVPIFGIFLKLMQDV